MTKFLKQKTTLFCLSFLGLLIFFALLIPALPGIDPNYFDPNHIQSLQAPSLHHIFGTDELGRDIFVRVFYGARISLAVGLLSVAIAILVGTIVGICSGWMGGWGDEILMRSTDFLMALPTIFLILIIQTLLSPSLFHVMAVIGLTSWMGVARLVRAEVLSVKERLFVTAAKARGIRPTRLVLRHILPHTLNPVIVAATLHIGSAILTESVLSFLGLGIQPPNASWGNMLENSLSYLTDAPWLAITPGIFITLTVLSFNFLGDALRSHFNPKEELNA